MDKILIEVYAPILGKTFDIFIPQECQMFEILDLIKKAVADMSDGTFAANDSTALCNRSDGTILNINLSAYELGLHNGLKLILI